MSDGWEESAPHWIAALGARGDFGREFVLDAPMLERIRAKEHNAALDVGCGEGRFCRLMQAAGLQTVGIDPTLTLIRRARELDPAGDYREGRAEALDFPDASFDLVVCYLTLIDIADLDSAIAEIGRVLRPDGTLLIANLTGFSTAAVGGGWTKDPAGTMRFSIDNYLTERSDWASWSGINVRNWHRPLSRYMALLLAQGLTLRHFSEPEPNGGPLETAERYRRVPWFVMMEWEKPR
jgi:SAM-dependent methyltransferase